MGTMGKFAEGDVQTPNVPQNSEWESKSSPVKELEELSRKKTLHPGVSSNRFF